MSLFQRLRSALNLPAPAPSTPASGPPSPPLYRFDRDTLRLVSLLAGRERRPVEEVAAGLLREAFSQRETAETGLRRWQRLTSREQQVAALVCLNLTNRQIAACLGRSPETVKSHLVHVLGKFGLRRRTELRLALSDWDFSGCFSSGPSH